MTPVFLLGGFRTISSFDDAEPWCSSSDFDSSLICRTQAVSEPHHAPTSGFPAAMFRLSTTLTELDGLQARIMHPHHHPGVDSGYRIISPLRCNHICRHDYSVRSFSDFDQLWRFRSLYFCWSTPSHTQHLSLSISVDEKSQGYAQHQCQERSNTNSRFRPMGTLRVN